MDAIEPESKNAADDSAEIPQQCNQHDTRGKLIRSVPVAELKKHSRPQPSFEETKEEADSIEALAIGNRSMATQYDAPRCLEGQGCQILVKVGLTMILACHTDGFRNLTTRFDGASAKI